MITSRKSKEKKTSGKWTITIIVVILVAVAGIIAVTLIGTKGVVQSDSVFYSFTNELDGYTITDETSAITAIESISDQMGISNARDELVLSAQTDVSGQTYYNFSQYYKGIPVYGRSLTISANSKSEASALTSNYIPVCIESTSADISESKACTIVTDYLSDTYNFSSGDVVIADCYLCIYNLDDGADKLSWCISALASSDVAFINETIIVNAVDGSIISAESNINFDSDLFDLKGQTEMQYDVPVTVDGNTYYLSDESRNISVYKPISSQNKYNYYVDNNHRVMIDGSISEDNNTLDSSDESGVDAMKNVSSSYDYFHKRFGRKSFDNNSSPIMVYVHTAGYEKDGANKSLYNNAFSANFTELTYGYVTMLSFPDKSILDNSCFANLLDVVAHEYTHSVTNSIAFTASTDDCSQTAALQEAYSDIFGELVEQYVTGHTDWVIDASGNRPRYLYSPASGNYTKVEANFPIPVKTVKYPTNMREFEPKADGHISSTLISHCAYLMSNDCTYGEGEGLSYEKLGDLWFGSVFYLTSDSGFCECRRALEIVANNMASDGKLNDAQLKRIRWALGETGIESVNNSTAITIVQNGLYINVLDNDGASIDKYTLTISSPGNSTLTRNIREGNYYVQLATTGLHIIAVSAEGTDSNGKKVTASSQVIVKVVDTETDSITDQLSFHLDLWKITELEDTAAEPVDDFNKVEVDLSNQGLTDISFLSGRTDITHLYLSFNEITDISVLSELTNLRELDLNNNSISDITPLSGLTKLTSLELRGNKFSDITPLVGLTELNSLNLMAIKISDLSPLAKLSNLTSLKLSGQKISDITSLAELRKLTHLELFLTSINDFTPLLSLPELTYLDLGANDYISDFSPLSKFTGLTGLSLYGNDISDLSPLAGLTELTYLKLDSNDISDLSPLAGLTKLTELYLNNNNISDLSPLAGLTGLTTLVIYDNEIKNINPLAGLANLTTLQLDYNNISDLSPLSGLIKLTYLSISSNGLKDITPLSSLTELSELDLCFNNIGNISSLSGLTKLTSLETSFNQISDIKPLSGLTELTVLNLSTNRINNITPLSGLTRLTTLVLRSNSISDITPLAGLTELTDLNICYNKISDVSPLYGLVKLQTIELPGNEISERSMEALKKALPNCEIYD